MRFKKRQKIQWKVENKVEKETFHFEGVAHLYYLGSTIIDQHEMEAAFKVKIVKGNK